MTRVQLAASLTPPAVDDSGARVINVLLVGSDSSAGLDLSSSVQIGRNGERNGDVIIIAHLDEREGTAALLSIPRDLWVTIAQSKREAKINSAFATGGPAGLIDTIEQNLGIPINYYVNVDFAGFEGLVDAVGSVEVYFPEPARDWNPEKRATQTGFEMLEAGCQALDAPTALAYVRSRYYQTLVDGTWRTDPRSDLGRIRRQQDFLQRLAARAIDLGVRNPFVLRDLIDASLQNVSIDQDLTPQLLLDLGRVYGAFEPGALDAYTFPTRSAMIGSTSALLPLDDDAKPIIEYFKGAPASDPVTVGLEVRHGRSEADLADLVITDLTAEGYEVEARTGIDLDPGITVLHGPDGASAAQGVARALREAARMRVSIREVPEDSTPALTGRNIQVLIGAVDLVIPEFPIDDAVPDNPEPEEPVPAEAVDPTADGANGDGNSPSPEAAPADDPSACS